MCPAFSGLLWYYMCICLSFSLACFCLLWRFKIFIGNGPGYLSMNCVTRVDVICIPKYTYVDIILAMPWGRVTYICVNILYPTLAREFQGFRVWGKFVFRTLELTDTPTNLANQVKVGHALDQSRSVQSRGPERAHQNNEPSWRSSRADRRLSRQFWDD